MNYRKLPAGVGDTLPAECRILTEIKVRLQNKFTACGFEPVSSAALEYYDTYAATENRIPQERMFKLTDVDGKLLVLRPDTTLSISRIAAANGVSCARLFYFADKWDLRNAGGIYDREVYQAGVECLGEEGVFSDAQAIAFAAECLKETGLENFVIDVGHVDYFKGILEESGLSDAQTEEVRAFVDAKDAPNVERALRRAGADERTVGAVLALPYLFGGEDVLDKAESLTENARARAAAEHLKKLGALLCEMGYGKYICFDLAAVRKLSYYSGAVFTVLTKEFGAPLLSGGRYDNLADDFGKHVPAVGFAIGLKRLAAALERQGSLPEIPAPALVVAADAGAECAAYRVFRRLTDCGTRARLSAETGRASAERERKSGNAVLFVTKDGAEESL